MQSIFVFGIYFYKLNPDHLYKIKKFISSNEPSFDEFNTEYFLDYKLFLFVNFDNIMIIFFVF